MIILMVRMIILMGQDDGFPTPPHPSPNGVFGHVLGVPSYWAFPVSGRSHGLAAAAPGHGQVALGAKKVALDPGPRSRSRSAPPSSSQAPLGHGLAPPPPGHGQISNWKRPLNFRKRHMGWGGVGWGAAGWGGD